MTERQARGGGATDDDKTFFNGGSRDRGNGGSSGGRGGTSVTMSMRLVVATGTAVVAEVVQCHHVRVAVVVLNHLYDGVYDLAR